MEIDLVEWIGKLTATSPTRPPLAENARAARFFVVAFGVMLLERYGNSDRTRLSGFIRLPTVFLHELCHYAMAWLVGGRPEGLSLRQMTISGVRTDGHVRWRNSNRWNVAPVSLAPLLLWPLAWWLIQLTVLTELAWGISTLLLFLAISAICGCWPSATDWRLARQHPFGFLPIAAVGTVLFYVL